MDTEQVQLPNAFFDLNSILSSLGIGTFDLFGRWTLIQIAIIVGSALLGRLIVNRLREPINERLSRIENQHSLLRTLIILHRRLFWLIFAIETSIGYAVLRSITWPSHSYIVRTVAELAIAWFLISFMSKIIRNRFTSRLVAGTAWTVTALYILGWLPKVQATLDSAAFSIGSSRISALAVIQTGLLLVFLIWAAMLTSQFLGNLIGKNDDISPAVKVLLQKILKFILLILAVIFSLNAVGIDFTALAVFSGALGIGVGLGLQNIVSNFISGIILLLDKSMKPGDVIEIDTVSGSTYGWVQHLGARYTAVRTRDGTETLIPNETFIKSPVTNWTHSNKVVRKKLPIGVSYDTDVEKAIKLAIEAADAITRVLKVPKPVCLVKGFGDSSVDLELRFWINDPEGGIANVSSQIYLEVWKRYQKAKIEIPFPQRDLNIRSSVPLEVKTKR